MIANYGYKDGSGDFFIAIDTDKCTGCEDCVKACPAGVMAVAEDENDPLSDKKVARVTNEQRKKLKYACANAGCKVAGQTGLEKCMTACKAGAISHSW